MIPNLRYKNSTINQLEAFSEGDIVVDVSNTEDLRWFLIDTITAGKVRIRRIKPDGEITLIPVYINAEDFLKRMRVDGVATRLLKQAQISVSHKADTGMAP